MYVHWIILMVVLNKHIVIQGTKEQGDDKHELTKAKVREEQ